MKISVSATEFFRCNKSQKNLRPQNSPVHTKRFVCTDLNPSSTSKMCGTVVIDLVTLFREEAYMLTCLGFVSN